MNQKRINKQALFKKIKRMAVPKADQAHLEKSNFFSLFVPIRTYKSPIVL